MTGRIHCTNGYRYRHHRIFILISLLPHPNLFLSLAHKDSNRHTSDKPTQGAKKVSKNFFSQQQQLSNLHMYIWWGVGWGEPSEETLGTLQTLIFINMVSLRGRLRCKHYSALQKGRWKQDDLHTRHLEPEFISADTPNQYFLYTTIHKYTKDSNLPY